MNRVAGPQATAQYEAVRAKIDEGMAVKDAIESVAQERGASPASVHTTYYRTAKDMGVLAPRRTPSRQGSLEETPSEELLRQAMEALTLLARRAESLEKDAERLRQIQRTLTDA